MVNEKDFGELCASVRESGEIMRGEAEPSRVFQVERVHDWVSYCEAHGLDPVEELKRRRVKFWVWVGMLAGCVAFWVAVILCIWRIV